MWILTTASLPEPAHSPSASPYRGPPAGRSLADIASVSRKKTGGVGVHQLQFVVPGYAHTISRPTCFSQVEDARFPYMTGTVFTNQESREQQRKWVVCCDEVRKWCACIAQRRPSSFSSISNHRWTCHYMPPEPCHRQYARYRTQFKRSGVRNIIRATGHTPPAEKNIRALRTPRLRMASYKVEQVVDTTPAPTQGLLFATDYTSPFLGLQQTGRNLYWPAQEPRCR